MDQRATPSRIADHASPASLNWAPMIEDIVVDVAAGVPVAEISAKFHNALAGAMWPLPNGWTKNKSS